MSKYVYKGGSGPELTYRTIGLTTSTLSTIPQESA